MMDPFDETEDINSNIIRISSSNGEYGDRMDNDSENTPPRALEIISNLRMKFNILPAHYGDKLLCPSCQSVLDEGVTFPCGHSYCGDCKSRDICKYLCEGSPKECFVGKTIIITCIVRELWNPEYEGICLRRQGIKKFHVEEITDAISLFSQALQKSKLFLLF